MTLFMPNEKENAGQQSYTKGFLSGGEKMLLVPDQIVQNPADCKSIILQQRITRPRLLGGKAVTDGRMLIPGMHILDADQTVTKSDYPSMSHFWHRLQPAWCRPAVRQLDRPAVT
jgi:hypothetical protein